MIKPEGPSETEWKRSGEKFIRTTRKMNVEREKEASVTRQEGQGMTPPYIYKADRSGSPESG